MRREHMVTDHPIREAPAVAAECMEIAAMADAFGVPYASHGGGAHLHFLAAMPNCLLMESGLLPPGSPVRLVDGCYPLPEGPGLSTH